MMCWILLCLLCLGCSPDRPRVQGPAPPMPTRTAAPLPRDAGWGLADFGEKRDGPVLAQLDADHELIQSRGLWIREKSSGRTALLDEKGDRFLALQDNRLLFLRPDGELLSATPLYTFESIQKVSLGHFSRLVALRGSSVFLATATRPVQLVQFKAGTQQADLVLAGLEVAPESLALDLSPDERKLALGYPEKPFETAALAVFDLESGQLVRIHGGIPVRVLSAERIPTLECGWVNDHTVRFSVSQEDGFHWCDLDLTAGRQVDRGRYAPLGARHRSPIPEAVSASNTPAGPGLSP